MLQSMASDMITNDTNVDLLIDGLAACDLAASSEFTDFIIHESVMVMHPIERATWSLHKGQFNAQELSKVGLGISLN